MQSRETADRMQMTLYRVLPGYANERPVPRRWGDANTIASSITEFYRVFLFFAEPKSCRPTGLTQSRLFAEFYRVLPSFTVYRPLFVCFRFSRFVTGFFCVVRENGSGSSLRARCRWLLVILFFLLKRKRGLVNDSFHGDTKAAG